MCNLPATGPILAVKSDSLLALENKPMLIKKAKKDIYSVIPILVMFALIIIFNIMNTGFDVNTPFLKYESLPQFLNVLASGKDFNRRQKDDCLYMKDYITNLFSINEQKFLKSILNHNNNTVRHRL